MSASKRWWMVLVVAVVMLAAPSCTENDLDESDADVILEILGINNPDVQGDTGAGSCSGDPTIICLDSQVCQDNQAGFCDFVAAECTIVDWTVAVKNSPLNQAGIVSPLNDIVISSVTLSYLEQDGVTAYVPDSTVPLSVTILAGTQGSIEFAPLSFDDLAAGGDSLTVDVLMSFAAQTVSGHAVTIVGGTGSQLFIEDCIP